MYIAYILVGFVFISLLMSFLLFSIFAKNQERFIKYWGLFWVAYSLSLVFLVLSIYYDNVALLEIRRVFDMYNIIFLLFGAYAFVHLENPIYWYRFSFYICIWICLGLYYKFDRISTYMPVALFQIIITAVLCRVIWKYWQIPRTNKVLVIAVFSMWGIGKALSSVYELYFQFTSSIYLLEIIFTNVLSFCIFIIYIQRVESNAASGEKLYHTIAENATDVIFYYSLSPKPAFTYITPSIEAMTGYAPKEFYQNPKFYLNIVDPEYFASVTEIFSGKSQDSDSTDIRIVKLRDKNDIPKWCEFHNKIIRNDGRPAAIESFVRDISLMKEAEEHLINSKNSRELLLSYISHELKTPVSSILGYVTGILDGIITDKKEVTSALELIFSKTMILERLIDDLFMVSKLETNQFSFHFVEISALELCLEILKKNTFDITSADLKFHINSDWDELRNVYLIADLERINQVFSNIIYNAIKFSMPQGTITVDMKLTDDEKALQVSISDTGVGIPEKDLPFVFDRFFKSKEINCRSKYGGSGLGLTLSKQIIEGHEGHISAQSDLGKGSVFTFEIPLYLESN